METLTLENPTKNINSTPLVVSALLNNIRKGEVKLSYTAISKFRESPRTFIDYKLKPKVETKDMLLGKMLHCMVLEPEKVAEKYKTDAVIVEQLIQEGSGNPRATKKYKEWISLQSAKIVSSDLFEIAAKMANAVLTNFASKNVLSKIKDREKKVEFIHNGLKFIGFIDGDGEVVIDIKKCKNAHPDKFRRDIVNNGYWLQAGVYTVANDEIKPYYLIAVDESGGVSVHELEESFIEYGIDQFDRLTKEFNECLENDDFDKSFDYRSVSPDGSFRMSRPPYL